jgi:isopenicillin-N N-acyltransferase-like protein
MIGEVTKGACSMIGAWGKALGRDGLLTARALDWSVEGPFRDYPEIVIYHAENDSENTFLNMGWIGWIGSITGVNDKGMSIHEIGVAFPDASFGSESRIGIPFTFLLRDVLQFDKTQAAGVDRVRNAHRTCNLILGVGGGPERVFNSMGVSASAFNLNTDKNMLPEGDWHPRMEGLVYHAMDWNCPSFSEVMAARLKAHYGNLTHEDIIRDVLPLTSTGNLHIYVADLVNQQLWVANAQRSTASGEFYAFNRPYIHMDLPSFWSISQPMLA